MKHPVRHQYYRRLRLVTLILVTLLAYATVQPVYAISTDDIDSITGGTAYYDPYASSVTGSGGCNSPLLPNIVDESGLANAINAYINKVAPGAPLNGLGAAFVQAGASNGINPIWMTTIAQQESSFGQAIPPNSFNPFGLTATASQPGVVTNNHRFYVFGSWQEAITHEAEYLKQNYIDQGLVTFPAIVHKYAPNGDGANNEEAYVANVTSSMDKILTLAASSLVCTSGNVQAVSGERASLNQRLLANPLFCGGNAQKNCPRPYNDIVSGAAQDAIVILLIQIVEQGNLPVSLSVLKTGHDCRSAEGNVSNHSYGLAADISGTSSNPNIVALQQWLYSNASSLNIDELIHEPLPSGVSDLDHGKPFVFKASTQEDHFDHIHVSVNGIRTGNPC